MTGIDFDIAHMLAGFLVLLSFLMLYQVRLLPLLNVLAAHAFVLSLSVAWQAYIQHAPHLYITAGIALVFKAIIVPWALRRMVIRMGIHREIETVFSIGLTMLAGMALVALSLEVMLPLTAKAEPVVREDIALALYLDRRPFGNHGIGMRGEHDGRAATRTLANAAYIRHIVDADFAQAELLHLGFDVRGAHLLFTRRRGRFDEANPLVHDARRASVDRLHRLSDIRRFQQRGLEPSVLRRKRKRSGQR